MTSESLQSDNSKKLYRKLPAWLSSYERQIISTMPLNAKWEQGRQGTGYEKASLMDEVSARWVVQRALDTLGGPTRYDAWLLHYPVGSEITPHTDEAEESMCHIRLNSLVVASAGGMLCLDGEELALTDGDAYIFRPDTILHSVAAVKEQLRLVLSVGANVEHEHAQALGLTK